MARDSATRQAWGAVLFRRDEAAPSLLNPRLGILVLVAISVALGSNHVAARIAMDHGASVSAAVAVRSLCTATVLLALLTQVWKVPVRLQGRSLRRALFVGLLVSVQSYCLYSAVRIIPVALALLVFQTFPLLYMLINWAAGHEKLDRRALVAMPLALVGLAITLDVRVEGFAGRWAEIGTGVLWALTASVSFATVFFLNGHWLKALDGRTRTFYMLGVTGILVLAAGLATDALVLPHDGTGWTALVALTLLYGGALTSLFVVLPKLQGSASTVALNSEPIAVLGIAWLVLGQAVSGTQIFGAFLTMGAIAYLSLRKG